VVLDHDSGRLVWAAEGRDEDTLDRFFFELGDERAKLITHISADAGSWIANVVAIRCPNAVRCMDPFHVTKWATDALDQVRREVWNAARRAGDKQVARDLKGARWALWKGGERISARQRAKLAWIERTNRPLYQAYLLKEHLRLVFQLPFDAALDLLEAWLEWADYSPLQPFVELAHSIDEHLEAILNALDHGLSKGAGWRPAAGSCTACPGRAGRAADAGGSRPASAERLDQRGEALAFLSFDRLRALQYGSIEVLEDALLHEVA